MKDIELIRGDTLTLVFPLTDDDGNTIGMDEIETFFLTARQYPNKESTILFSKEKKDFSFVDNLYEVEILPTETETMLLKKFYFDIEVTLIDGTRKTKIVEVNLVKDYTIHGGDKVES